MAEAKNSNGVKYIVDTHSLVWYFAGDRRLSSKVKQILQEAEQGRNEIIIPAIVLLEAIDIQEKKRVQFEIEKLFDFIERRDNFAVVCLTFTQIKEMVKMGKGLDLHDRVIFTTAELFKSLILTKDPELRKVAKTIW